MGSSLLSEKESGRRPKEKEREGDIRQLQTAASLSSLVSGWFLQKSRQPLKSCWDFQKQGVIAGSMCATSRVANIIFLPAWELWKYDKCLGSFSFYLN